MILSSIRKYFKHSISSEQYSLASPLKEMKFGLSRGSGNRASYLWNRFSWYVYPKIHHVSQFPTHVDIEAASTCQLNCPMCYTTTDHFKKTVNQRCIDYELFKKVIDECRSYSIYSIRLSWRGESLLHPRLIDMVSYAKESGIKEVSFLTNGEHLTLEMIDGLINNGLDWVTVSFDGLYDTYEKIRAPLKFDETVAKLKLLKRRKKELGSAKPVVKVQSIWPAISNDPSKYYDFMSDIVDEVAFNPIKKKEYYYWHDKEMYKEDFVCPKPWQRIMVTASGNIVPCIADVYEEEILGNIRDTTIFDVWHGDKLNELRRKHLEKDRFKFEICARCQLGLKTQPTLLEVGGNMLEATKYGYTKPAAVEK